MGGVASCGTGNEEGSPGEFGMDSGNGERVDADDRGT